MEQHKELLTINEKKKVHPYGYDRFFFLFKDKFDSPNFSGI